MKTSLFVFLLFASFANAQEILPIKASYERALTHYTAWKNGFDNPDYWKSVNITRVSDKKLLKVKDLEEFDRQSFYISNLRRLGYEMTRLNKFWTEEFKKYTVDPPTQEGVPTLDELKVYIDKLTDLRSDAAKTLETYVEKFVKDNAAKLTKDEGAQLLKEIRTYHDENNLIKRK